MKGDATQIKRLEISNAAFNFDINEAIRVPHKKRVSNGVLPNCKQQGKTMELRAIACLTRR